MCWHFLWFSVIMGTYLRESDGRRMLVVTELLTEKEGVTQMPHLVVVFAKLCSQNTMWFIIYSIHTLKAFYWFLYYMRYCIFIFPINVISCRTLSTSIFLKKLRYVSICPSKIKNWHSHRSIHWTITSLNEIAKNYNFSSILLDIRTLNHCIVKALICILFTVLISSLPQSWGQTVLYC